jgi:hypothetical protein
VAQSGLDRPGGASTLERISKPTKTPTDLNQRAKAIVDLATSDEPLREKDEARAAGIATYPWSLTQIAELLD